jgi:hypothetical protein
MYSHAEDYALFVMERYAEAQVHTKDALIYLEQRLDMTAYVPEGFGTGDCVIIADGVMDIIDLKYGKGVLVSATDNKQMMLYSLGALREFDFMYDIRSVRMTIFQPRLDNYSTFEMTVDDLMTWAENELKHKAALAFKGEGEFIPGKHCQFCKAKAVCKALADYILELAKHDFAAAETLTDDDIADILDRAGAFKNWIKAVEEHALSEATEHGKRWKGYKLVEGRSNRKYVNEEEVAKTLLASGYKEDTIYAPREILGITAMEKAITKAAFAEKLKGLVIKPQGAPTLVPLGDKRPALNSADAAANDFKEVINQ